MMGYIPPQTKPQPPAPVPVGDAQPTDVRAGKSFSSADGTEVLGTLPERSTGPITITPGSGAQSKPAGIYGGAINVPAVTVPAANVLAGTTIAGTAGTMPNRGAGGVVTPNNTTQTKAAGYYSSAITINPAPSLGVIAPDPDILQVARNMSNLYGYTPTPTKVISATVRTGGTYRIRFSLGKTSGGALDVFGRIYVNGVAVGIQRTNVNPNTVAVVFTEDIKISDGDTVELYLWCLSGTAVCNDFVFDIAPPVRPFVYAT